MANDSCFALVVGVITDRASRIRELLTDLESLAKHDCVTGLTVITLANGAAGSGLLDILDAYRQRGLSVQLISEEQQRHDAGLGTFGTWRERSQGRVEIAKARTILQRYVGQIQVKSPGAIAWLLDDDLRLDARMKQNLSSLPRFREAGVDILIGSTEGSSPNPPLCGAWVQLWDLYRNLIWLQSLDPKSPLPDRSMENSSLRNAFPDYYYDLTTKHSDHLEAVYWTEPHHPGETVRQAIDRLACGALGILGGEPLSRPVLSAAANDPLNTRIDSINRGGSTFVFNPRALLCTPNTMIEVGGRAARRSDMLWAIINRYHHNLTCQRAEIPVQHVGSRSVNPTLDIQKVVEEIVGSSVVGAYQDHLQREPHFGIKLPEAAAIEVTDEILVRMSSRLKALTIRFKACQELIPKLLVVMPHSTPDKFEISLRDWFRVEMIALISAGVRSVDRPAVMSFVEQLPATVEAYASATLGSETAEIGKSR